LYNLIILKIYIVKIKLKKYLKELINNNGFNNLKYTNITINDILKLNKNNYLYINNKYLFAPNLLKSHKNLKKKIK